MVIKREDPEEIAEVKTELEEEGFTSDEAVKLIQQVYRKIGGFDNKSKGHSYPVHEKSWDEAMDELKNLMQIIHTNNMEFHGIIKKSKNRIELKDIKNVQNANYIRICGPIDTENDTLPNTPTRDQGDSSNHLTSHFEAARRKTSVSRFYTDQGPREDWDSPLNKFVKVTELRNRRQSCQKTTVTGLENMLPCQSLITENDSMELLSQVQSAARRGSHTLHVPKQVFKANSRPLHLDVMEGNKFYTLKSPKLTPRKTSKISNLPPDATFIDHLHAMKRKDSGDADSGPFDFRSILKRSDYAPTDSLRRRNGPNGRPIPRIIKSPAPSDETQQSVSVTYNEESAIE